MLFKDLKPACESPALWRHLEACFRRASRMREGCETQAQIDDVIWDACVLDVLSPLELSTRDALRREATGLPWGGRLDLGLYWRILYSALAEDRRGAKDLGPRELLASPLRLIVSSLFFPFMDELRTRPTAYAAIASRAAREIGLRSGWNDKAVPLPIHSVVRAHGQAALLESYGFDGRLLLDRETKPIEGALEWRCLIAERDDTLKSGRWQAWAEPEHVTLDRR